eukprot:162532-Chlamydomonas_euryale.AAC.6
MPTPVFHTTCNPREHDELPVALFAPAWPHGHLVPAGDAWGLSLFPLGPSPAHTCPHLSRSCRDTGSCGCHNS